MTVLVFSEEYTKLTKGMYVVWMTHALGVARDRRVNVLLNREHWALKEAPPLLTANPRITFGSLPFRMPGPALIGGLGARRAPWIWRAARFALHEAANAIASPFVIFYLYRRLRRIRPCALFSHAGGWPAGPLCRWIIYAGALARVPSRVLIIHNYPAKRPGRLWGLMAALPRWLQARGISRCTTAIVTVSDSVRTSLEAQVFKSALLRIHNGIVLSPAGPVGSQSGLNWRPEGPTIGFVGALYPLKGPHVLLDAFRLVDASCELALLGPAEPAYLQDLQRRARLCANKVSFLGFQDDVDSFMSQIDFLVVPSIAFESFGMVILEAMKHRKAVVCSDFGGMKEIVEHGVTGLVVPASDITALARAMMTLLADEPLRRRMGEAGYRRLEKCFSAERMVAQYNELALGR
jgi:teichuronic acid biosynthesis glycosyltransferase TuaC